MSETNNPSPEMLEMREQILTRIEKANEIVGKAFGEIRNAANALSNITSGTSQADRQALAAALQDAQVAYARIYDEQKQAYLDAVSHFDPP